MRKETLRFLFFLLILSLTLFSCQGVNVKTKESTDPLEIFENSFSAAFSGQENGVSVSGILRAERKNSDGDRDFEFCIFSPESLAGLTFSHKAGETKTVLRISEITEEQAGIFLPPAAAALVSPKSGTLGISSDEVCVATDSGEEYIYRFGRKSEPTAVTVKNNAGNEISRIEISNFEVYQ